MLSVVIDDLKKVAKDFYNLTNIMIVLFDDARNLLYSYPEEHSPFCSELRKIPELAQKCYDCDNYGFDYCENTHKTYIYKCHTGLTEAISPIFENNIIIGYVMLGQIICDGDQETVLKKISSTAKNYPVSEKNLIEFLKHTKVVSNEILQSTAGLLSMCACYLFYNKVIVNHSDELSYQIKEYIDNHISDDLSIPNLCKALYISRTKLYNISVHSFGLGISDYISNRRIELSKKALANTSKPISVVANDVGFNDSNYFSRVFKRYTGMSPRQYRQNCK